MKLITALLLAVCWAGSALAQNAITGKKYPPTIAGLEQQLADEAAVQGGNALDASVVVRAINGGHTAGIGSGTIIDARNGHCLIITAGHVVKECDGRRVIRVSFRDGQTADGRMLGWAQSPDVGFVSVKASPPAVVSVSVSGPAVGETVKRIGMFGMTDGRVVSVNKFHGASNFCIGGQAIEADSGGGVFNVGGELIGVISARDLESNETITVGTSGPSSIASKMADVTVTKVGCRWVRDACGNWVQVCDNRPGGPAPQWQPQPIQRPPQQQRPPVQQPPRQPELPVAQPVTPPMPGPPGPQGPEGPPGPPGPPGAAAEGVACDCGPKWVEINAAIAAIRADIDASAKATGDLTLIVNELSNRPPAPTMDEILAEVKKRRKPPRIRIVDPLGKYTTEFVTLSDSTDNDLVIEQRFTTPAQ